MRIQRGTIERGCCERCGAKDAQSHHDDYTQPLAVRWLCSKCHGEEHYPDAGKGWGHDGTAWCSGHKTFLPVRAFTPQNSYCRACRNAYLAGLKAKKREEYEAQMAALARKYANR
jgi:ribosomal protein S27AE